MPESLRRLCLQWPRLGPYHLARLRATHALLAPRGVEVIALETAAGDATYAWRRETDTTTFRRVTVFSDAALEHLAPARVHTAVTATLDALRPDAVAINSYSLPDARACLTWARRRRRVAVLMSDSKADDAPRMAWKEVLKRSLVQAFDAALVAGTPHADYYASLGLPPRAIFQGYDVVDNAFFATGAAAVRSGEPLPLPGLEDSTPFFLASNRFIARKNLYTLLAAYQRYRSEAAAPWRLVLLGDGPLRGDLARWVEEHAVGGVTFAGFQQIDALPAFYGRAAAFVHPARQDQWGLVVNEAMAAGLPVLVSTGAGCAHDLVAEGENGFTFRPDDPAQLAVLLQRLADPATDRAAMGAASQARVEAWSPSVFAERLAAAVQTGRPRSDRPFPWDARLILWLLRHLARSPRAFHSVEA